MIEELDKNIIDDYYLALNGRTYWLDLKKKYSFGEQDGLIIYEIEKKEYLDIMKMWLPNFLERKQFEKTVIVGAEKLDIKNQSNYVLFEENIEKEKVLELLKYYRLTRFTKNIYGISLNMPFGNENMIGHKGITFFDWLRNFG